MSARRSTLVAVLLWTMTATSFQIFIMAVLAADIIADLGLSRAQLGLIGSLNTAVGAVTAPFTGRLTDRIGPWNSAIAGMAIAAVGLAVMALSPNALVLSVSALISGVPQGWGNPATNALIAERVVPGFRGTITGIKQSGVQFGVFLSGFTLPTLALWLSGWRGAIWTYSAAFALGAVITAVVLPRKPAVATPGSVGGRSGEPGDRVPVPSASNPADDSDVPSVPREMDPWIWRLAGFALLMGLVGGVIGRFFPLWAEEALGMSTTRAGLIVALTGLLGIVARIFAGRVAEDLIEPSRLLRILAAIGALFCLLLVLTPWIGTWVLWPTAALNAVGIGAWNAVAMLAIIMVVPGLLAGRASGVVMLGFLGGLSIGPPIAGWAVDRWGSYQPVWVVCILFAVLAMLSLGWERDRSRTDRSVPVGG